MPKQLINILIVVHTPGHDWEDEARIQTEAHSVVWNSLPKILQAIADRSGKPTSMHFEAYKWTGKPTTPIYYPSKTRGAPAKKGAAPASMRARSALRRIRRL